MVFDSEDGYICRIIYVYLDTYDDLSVKRPNGTRAGKKRRRSDEEAMGFCIERVGERCLFG